jgi:hypothetical protein
MDKDKRSESVKSKKYIFDVELIDNQQTILTNLNIDFDNFQIKLTTLNKNKLELIIPFIEIIGVNEVKNLDRLKKVDLDNKRVFKINYYNSVKRRECNCCGIFCCNCRQIVFERIMKKMDVVAHINNYDNIVSSIKKINTFGVVNSVISSGLRRKYLFFLNPIGGSGKSRQVWESVLPILSNLCALTKIALI